MFRLLTRFWVFAMFWLLGGPSTFAFALLGRTPPNVNSPDGYQQPVIGYQLTTNGSADIGTPKNLGEGYRWNARNVYYACDANFFNYFGSNGLKAIDQAFGIMNNLAPVSTYSADLSEWPLNSSRINHRAAAVGLVDVKSIALSLLVEQMGLAEPDRWTWCLRSRAVGPAPGCPIEMIYDVIQRNFDPVTYEPTSYVNGTLYSYNIVEICAGAPPLADAVEFQVDPAAETRTAVAAFGVGSGQFYTGLTRDDVGGLRYQWASNRIYQEGIPTNTAQQIITTPTLIVTSNLEALVTAAQTNNPVGLQALFPALQFTSSFLYFSNVVTTNVITFFTNLPGSQSGSPATLAQTVTLTTNILPIYSYTFLNVITNFVYTNFGAPFTNQPGTQGYVSVQQTVISPVVGGAAGTLQTNTTSTTVLSNFVTGEFFMIPTNALCGYTILSNVLTQVTPVTNTVALTGTATNVGVQNFSIVTFFTNHTLAVQIPLCQSNTVSLREGVEKVNFFNAAFDSYLSTTWFPITNVYTMTAVTNGMPVTQSFYRVVNQPDFLITAADLLTTLAARTSNYNAANVGAGLAGPGNINPPVVFTFNKVGRIYQVPGISGSLNVFFIPPVVVPPFGEFNQALVFQLGSYDGTTNTPIAYPNGSSIIDLENNVFLQITVTGPLPSGNVGQFYSAQLTASGASPFTWTPTNNVYYPNGLPPGLNLSPTTGLISGTPTATGLYDFLVQISDAQGRVNQRVLQIEIDP